MAANKEIGRKDTVVKTQEAPGQTSEQSQGETETPELETVTANPLTFNAKFRFQFNKQCIAAVKEILAHPDDPIIYYAPSMLRWPLLTSVQKEQLTEIWQRFYMYEVQRIAKAQWCLENVHPNKIVISPQEVYEALLAPELQPQQKVPYFTQDSESNLSFNMKAELREQALGCYEFSYWKKSNPQQPSCSLMTVKYAEGLHSAEIAEDKSYVFGACGQIITAWNMAHEIQRSIDTCKNCCKIGSDEEEEDKNPLQHRLLEGHKDIVWGLSYDHTRQNLLSCSSDKTIKLWDIKSQECNAQFTAHAWPVFDVSRSPNDEYFGSASEDLTAMIWNYNRKEPINTRNYHTEAVTCIRFHPSLSYLVATGSADKSICLWSQTRDTEIDKIYHESKVTTMEFSPCGNYLTSGDLDGLIKIRDIRMLRNVGTLSTRCGKIKTIAYNKAGTIIAVAGQSFMFQIFQLNGLKQPAAPGIDRVPDLYLNSFNPTNRRHVKLLRENSCEDRRVCKLSFIENKFLFGIAAPVVHFF